MRARVHKNFQPWGADPWGSQSSDGGSAKLDAQTGLSAGIVAQEALKRSAVQNDLLFLSQNAVMDDSPGTNFRLIGSTDGQNPRRKEEEKKEKEAWESAMKTARQQLEERLQELDEAYNVLMTERDQIEARMHKKANGEIDWARYGQEYGVVREDNESDPVYAQRVEEELRERQQDGDLGRGDVSDFFENDEQIKRNRAEREENVAAYQKMESDSAFESSQGRYTDPVLEAAAVAEEERTGIKIERDKPPSSDIVEALTDNMIERSYKLYNHSLALQREGSHDITESAEIISEKEEVKAIDDQVGDFFREYARVQKIEDAEERYSQTKDLVSGASEDVKVLIFTNQDTAHLLDANLKFIEKQNHFVQTAQVSAASPAAINLNN